MSIKIRHIINKYIGINVPRTREVSEWKFVTIEEAEQLMSENYFLSTDYIEVLFGDTTMTYMTWLDIKRKYPCIGNYSTCEACNVCAKINICKEINLEFDLKNEVQT